MPTDGCQVPSGVLDFCLPFLPATARFLQGVNGLSPTSHVWSLRAGAMQAIPVLLFWEVKRKDFWENFAHHWVTLALIVYSHYLGRAPPPRPNPRICQALPATAVKALALCAACEWHGKLANGSPLSFFPFALRPNRV